MLHATRHFVSRAQQKCEAPRRTLADDSELPIVHACEAADLREIAAHQRKVMSSVHTSQLSDATGRLGVADPATERITGVGGVSDDAAVLQHRSGDPQQAELRVGGMDPEALRHEDRRRRII
jgi:hypothetical protein